MSKQQWRAVLRTVALVLLGMIAGKPAVDSVGAGLAQFSTTLPSSIQVGP